MLDKFISKYKQICKDDFDNFFHSLQRTSNKYFRINTARNIDYMQEFDDKSKFSKVDDFEAFKYNEEEINVSKTIGFLTGGLYIQNISSLFPPKFLYEYLDNKENPLILDMCAAPGGKTTYLSELFGRKGLIIANEISNKRLKALNFNLAKYGSFNVKTISVDGRLLSKKLPPCFDAVMLDAPCSNENKILKNEAVKNFWSDDFILNMQEIQKGLIENAFNVLKPGGILVYSTCTFSIEENENVIEYLLSKNEDALLVDINMGKYSKGISQYSDINDKVVRVWPHLMEYDGFFIAMIKKSGELESSLPVKRQNPKLKELEIFEEYFTEFVSIYKRENNYFILPSYDLDKDIFNKIRFRNGDFLLGSLIKDFMISTEASWEFGRFVKDSFKVKASYQESIEYLDGYDIESKCGVVKNGVVFYKDMPIGPFKSVNNKVKNKINRYFIYNRV